VLHPMEPEQMERMTNCHHCGSQYPVRVAEARSREREERDRLLFGYIWTVLTLAFGSLIAFGVWHNGWSGMPWLHPLTLALMLMTLLTGFLCVSNWVFYVELRRTPRESA